MDENNKALIEIKNFNSSIVEELKKVKAKYEDDEHKYNLVSKKLVLSEKLCTELESNYSSFKHQNEIINSDVQQIKYYSQVMKTIIDRFEELNQKDNQRNMKFLIQLKIAQENTENELKLFKNNISKATDKLKLESDK